MTLTARSLFSGGEGVGSALRDAGNFLVIFDARQNMDAGGAKLNGFDTIVADILTVDPRQIERSDILHASPECTRASVANASTGESKLDIDMAKKVCEFIEVHQPKYFTLENVYQYRRFHSWWLIADTLNRNGYWHDFTHINAADFGVPQTRKRMIVRAIKDGFIPPLPPAEDWIGWYAAIEDLIPTLPPSKFADWQLDKLPEDPQTLLINSKDAGPEARPTPRLAHEPSATVRTDKGLFRAFLMSGNNKTSAVARRADQPAQTITSARVGGDRAFITDSRNNREGIGGDMTLRDQDEPMYTLPATSDANRHKAWLSQGRVVSMTTRALARFQSFPDDYILPDKKTLAAKVIGNAVPPLLYQKIIQGLITNAR